MTYTFLFNDRKETEITLHSCEADEAPEYADHYLVDSVGCITMRFSPEDMQLAKLGFDDVEKCPMYRFDITLTMRKHSDEGVLEFRTTTAGKEVGRATIDFE